MHLTHVVFKRVILRFSKKKKLRKLFDSRSDVDFIGYRLLCLNHYKHDNVLIAIYSF